MPLWKWSKTAASNATADSAINWAEGQAPSSVNDSARSMMARIAEYRDDIAGAIVTSGTAWAYTVSSNQVFDSLADMDGAMIAFTPHTTSGTAPTLSVDSLTAKKIRFQTGVDIPDGSLVQGTPYVGTYYNTTGEIILHNTGGNPYNLPLGAGIDFWGTTAPNSAFAFPVGQAISRTTYSTLFSIFGTTYGTGDGSTTFNLPDKRGRVSACPDNMFLGDAGRLSGDNSISRTTLGSAGGASSKTIAQTNLPAIAPTFTGTSATIDVFSTNSTVVVGGVHNAGLAGGSNTVAVLDSGSTIIRTESTGSYAPAGTISTLGSGTALPILQPTILCNYIMRIL